MENIIIIGILLVMIAVGIRSGAKHFKGEGGCCGGGSTVKKKRKKLKNVIAKKTVVVEGMTCEHCRDRVERSIDEIEGAAGKVNLRKKEAVVSMEREVTDEEIRAAIERAGYKVERIENQN